MWSVFTVAVPGVWCVGCSGCGQHCHECVEGQLAEGDVQYYQCRAEGDHVHLLVPQLHQLWRGLDESELTREYQCDIRLGMRSSSGTTSTLTNVATAVL